MSTASALSESIKPTKAQAAALAAIGQPGANIPDWFWNRNILRIFKGSDSDKPTIKIRRNTFEWLLKNKHLKSAKCPIRGYENSRSQSYVYALPGEVDRIVAKQKIRDEKQAERNRLAAEAEICNRNRRWRMAVLNAVQCSTLLVEDERLYEVFRLIVSEVNTGMIPEKLSEEAVCTIPAKGS